MITCARSWVLAWIYTSLTMILYVVFLALVHPYQLWTNFHLSRLNMKGNMPINKHSNGEHRPEAKIVTRDPQWFSNKQQKNKFHEFFFKISWNWFYGKNPSTPLMLELVYTFCYTLKALPNCGMKAKQFLRVGIIFFYFNQKLWNIKCVHTYYIWVYKYIFLNPSDTNTYVNISLKKYQNS